MVNGLFTTSDEASHAVQIVSAAAAVAAAEPTPVPVPAAATTPAAAADPVIPDGLASFFAELNISSIVHKTTILQKFDEAGVERMEDFDYLDEGALSRLGDGLPPPIRRRLAAALAKCMAKGGTGGGAEEGRDGDGRSAPAKVEIEVGSGRGGSGGGGSKSSVPAKVGGWEGV